MENNKILDFIDKNLEIINLCLKEAHLMYMMNGKEWWSSRGVALLLELGRNTMLKELRTLRVLKDDNTPQAHFANDHKGFFLVKLGTHNKRSTYYSKECIEFLREELAHLPKKKRKEYRPQPDNFFIDGLTEILNG